MLKNPQEFRKLVREEKGYAFLKQIRGSLPYWETFRLDLLAMIGQLGCPTIFLTLSCNELQWPELIICIGKTYNRHFTESDVEKMSYDEKVTWLNSNPVITARICQNRVHVFTERVLKHRRSPFGKMAHCVFKTEFQMRGSMHFHAFLWIEGAPKLGIDPDEDVMRYIEKVSSVSCPEGTPLSVSDRIRRLQSHGHRKHYCMKGETGHCRFDFPRLPSTATVIARKATAETQDEAEEALVIQEAVRQTLIGLDLSREDLPSL